MPFFAIKPISITRPTCEYTFSDVPVMKRAKIAAASPNGTMVIITSAEVRLSNCATRTRNTIKSASP